MTLRARANLKAAETDTLKCRNAEELQLSDALNVEHSLTHFMETQIVRSLRGLGVAPYFLRASVASFAASVLPLGTYFLFAASVASASAFAFARLANSFSTWVLISISVSGSAFIVISSCSVILVVPGLFRFGPGGAGGACIGTLG